MDFGKSFLVTLHHSVELENAWKDQEPEAKVANGYLKM